MSHGVGGALVLLFLTAACSPPAARSDAGDDVSFGTLPVLAGDMTCIGAARRPVGGAPVDQVVTLGLPFGGALVPDVTMWLFAGDALGSDCATSACLQQVSPSGSFDVTLAGGSWFAG